MLGAKFSSWFEKPSFYILALLMAFPLIDYVLRNLIPIPVISSIWDELLLVSGLILVCLRLLFGNPDRKTRLKTPILTAVLLGLAYLTLDLTTMDINFEGFRAVFQFMFVFFVAFYLIDRPENTKALLSVAVFTGTLIALYGIYQWVAKVPMPGDWIDAGEASGTRAFSIVGSPNALGSQMAMVSSLALGLFMQEQNKIKKLLWLGAFGIMVICLVFTGSRGAWIAWALSIAVLGIIYDQRILIAGLLLAVVAGLFVPAVSHRITYLFSSEYMIKSAQSGRISRWFEAYDQMRNSPMFGAGLGHFGGAVAKRNYNTIYVDNYYMKTLAETGLLGLSVFLWLIFSTIKEGYLSMKAIIPPRLKYMAMGMFGGLLAIAVHNAVENIFEIPYLNYYFWLTAGLLTALPFNAATTGGACDNDQ